MKKYASLPLCSDFFSCPSPRFFSPLLSLLKSTLKRRSNANNRPSPNVEFCGYSIPHPSEPKMNIRIQTYEGTAFEALEKGFDDLSNLCDVVAERFVEERERYGQH